MDKIDFRSDTVTWPTPTMRVAMAQAIVGDDVYGEDPTVNELEALAANMTGKEAALFVSSGTMGNLTAILSHAGRGDEAIVGLDSHSYLHEAGGMAALGGVTPFPLPTDNLGRMDVPTIEFSIREDDPHYPRSRLILLENSYGAKNGAAVPLSYFEQVATVARRNGLVVHLDGARLFNGTVALAVPAGTITQYVDSVTFCLSKGLCAPAGSILCGTAEFIQRARRIRKLLGGGMRQAGVLAAAGLVALREMTGRLADDHAKAAYLASGLAQIPGLTLHPTPVQTNIVFFSLTNDVQESPAGIIHHLRQKANIWLGQSGPRSFRAVTHYWIDWPHIDLFIKTLDAIL